MKRIITALLLIVISLTSYSQGKYPITVSGSGGGGGATGGRYTTNGYGVTIDSSTTNLYRTIVDTTVIASQARLSTMLALKLNISDTASMLSGYQAAINARVKYTDTSSMLSAYQTAINARVKYTDTSGMLSAYKTKIQTNIDSIGAHNTRIGANKTNTDSLKTPPTLGQIINEQFANISNFTTSGTATFTVVSNALQVASASGSIVYTNIAKQTAYGVTNLEDWVQTCQVTVGTITSTSFGIGIGVNSTSSGASLTAFVNLSSGSQGFLSITANGVTTSSLTALTVSAGHVLTYTLRRSKNVITFTVFNANNNLSQTVTLPLNMGYTRSITQILPTAANFTIFALGGTHTMDNWVITSDCVKNSVMFIGDSIFEGYNGSNANNRAVDILAKTFNDNFIDYSSQSNMTSDFSATEILSLAPSRIVINLGINNIGGGGQSAATAFTNLQSLISSITALTNPNTGNVYTVGTDLFICTILPRESNLSTIQTFNNSIRSTYTTSVIELEKPFLNAGGTAIDSTLYADLRGSATHPNDKGNQLMAEIIGNYQPLGFKKKAYAEKFFIPVTLNSDGRATIGNRFTNSDSNALVISHTANSAQLKLTQVASGLGVSFLSTTLGGLNIIQNGNFINGNYIAYAATPSIIYTDGSTFRWYANTSVTPGNTFTPLEKMRLTVNGGTGILSINTTAIDAQLNVLSTTEQQRTSYDASNYYSTTVGSTGGVTFNAVGTGSRFVYSDGITLPAGTSTATIGSPLKFITGTSLGTAEAGAIEYTTPQLFFTNGGGQRQEIPQIQQSRVSSDFSATSNTTLANVTGLTATLVAGKTYRFTFIGYTTSANTGGVKFSIAGTCTATNIIYDSYLFDLGNSQTVGTARGTALGTTVGDHTTVTQGNITINGTITVNAAGTLTCQFAQNNSDVTASVVLRGSTFVVTEML